MSPPSARRSPAMTLKSVVLPAPLTPIRPCRCPGSTLRVIPSRTTVAPKLLCIPTISSLPACMVASLLLVLPEAPLLIVGVRTVARRKVARICRIGEIGLSVVGAELRHPLDRVDRHVDQVAVDLTNFRDVDVLYRISPIIEMEGSTRSIRHVGLAQLFDQLLAVLAARPLDRVDDHLHRHVSVLRGCHRRLTVALHVVGAELLKLFALELICPLQGRDAADHAVAHRR